MAPESADAGRSRPSLKIAVAVLLGGFAVGVAADPRGLRLWVRLGHDVARIEAENERLAAEVEALRLQAAALRGDPRLLERAAREDLGYVRPDEILFKLE